MITIIYISIIANMLLQKQERLKNIRKTLNSFKFKIKRNIKQHL